MLQSTTAVGSAPRRSPSQARQQDLCPVARSLVHLQVLRPIAPFLVKTYFCVRPQYESSSGNASRSTEQLVTVRSLHSHKPVSLALNALCEAPQHDQLRCSQQTAKRNLKPLREWWILPAFGGPVGLQVWSGYAIVVLAGWARTLLLTLPWFAFVLTPASYVAGNLLRHVDTPVTPFFTVATLCAYTMTPVRCHAAF